MINVKDFALVDTSQKFDFRSFFNRIIGHWKWFLIMLIAAFVIAYQINIRQQKIYALSTSIAVKEQNNPFFTSNTSLVFNWGGTSDQVNNLITTLESRTHNEMVIDKLEFYIDYLIEDTYNYKDLYGEVPFFLKLDKTKPQLANQLIKVIFKILDTFVIETKLESSQAQGFLYNQHTTTNLLLNKTTYKTRHKIGKPVNLPYLNATFYLHANQNPQIGKVYLLKFNSLDATVEDYQKVKIESDSKATSIINLTLVGKNKARIVDYLNTTVEVLIKRQLDQKNQFATNTINFIDSTLVAIDASLKESENDLKNFSKTKDVISFENNGQSISNQILEYESQKDIANRKLAYYNNLTNYLNSSSTDFSKLPAPSVLGIDDPNIVMNVSKLMGMSNEKRELQYTRKNKLLFENIDNEMFSLKKTIQDNIKAAAENIKYDLQLANTKLNEFENTMRMLPVEQQEYLKISRKYELNDQIYMTFLSKRNEAEIVRAANLADIHFIDKAKDTGKGLIGPDYKINYILALIIGLFLPFLIILISLFLETSILKIEDITQLTNIPVLGVVGIKNTVNNLSVLQKPKSAIAESFRAIRSSLQFMYSQSDNNYGKVLLITSSISGEGKTFCSINLSTIYAISQKKTVLVGLDLRKPKIFDDFNLNSKLGVVNYLIGEKTINDIIQKTQLEHLDIIVSGPIPPNPSELLIGEQIQILITELKQKYEYVILDSAPIGLESDTISFSELVDVTLFVLKQKYSKKSMISMLNNRLQRGELKNVSIIFNGFESKTKYGYGYGDFSGYGYGYGSEGYGIEEDPKPTHWFQKIVYKLKQK